MKIPKPSLGRVVLVTFLTAGGKIVERPASVVRVWVTHDATETKKDLINVKVDLDGPDDATLRWRAAGPPAAIQPPDTVEDPDFGIVGASAASMSAFWLGSCSYDGSASKPGTWRFPPHEKEEIEVDVDTKHAPPKT